ncbi:MAG: poly-gamma-glutamate biosynthesis protein PgsC/CapC [Candidatus Omnitrophota bacterium]
MNRKKTRKVAVFNVVYIAIFVGLLVNLISVDVLGVILGGFVVPGYLAMQITKPEYIANIFLVAIITVLVVKFLANFMIIYGRKMLVISVLVGFSVNQFLFAYISPAGNSGGAADFGMIIPGLMAYWIQRQGIVETVALSLIGAVVTRLILVIVTGGVMPL